MFKDYGKYLSASLKVYLFVLVAIFIMKIVGLDYFGLDLTNPIIVKITTWLRYHRIFNILNTADFFNFIILYIQFYFYLCIVCNKRKLYISSFVGTLINFITQLILVKYFRLDNIYQIISILIMILIPMAVNKKITIKRQIKYILVISLYQLISMCIRNVGVNKNYNSFITDFILNLDQIAMLGINYNIFFMKGDVKQWEQVQVAGSSLLKKMNLKTLLKKLQKNYSNFKKLDKQEKTAIIIYSILSLIWNVFTLVVIIFIAKLNNTIIECLFILTSFWLTKRTFGKAFHLDSMIHCFIVSNASYYMLNRVTTPLGISIFVPILLGVGLSYVTSKFVKKQYKPLYKGMPEDLFEETILKVTDKDSTKYKVCYDFYIGKESDVSLSFKYNYSVAGIRKIKDRINEKIKGLN